MQPSQRQTITVDNRVRVLVTSPYDLLGVALKARFTYDNPAYKTWKTLHMGGPPSKRIQTWGTTHRGQVVSVPRGGYARVLQALQELGRVPHVRDSTVDDDQWCESSLELGTPLWPHQERLVDSFYPLRAVGAPAPSGPLFRNGLWRAPQGSGKTQAVLALACRLNSRTLIVVSNSSLFEQWVTRVRRELGFEPGIIRGPKRTVRAITIAMAQTLTKCATDYADSFGFVVLDEAQLCPADTMQQVFDPLRARYRLGVTGDERRADGKEFLTYDTFGPVTCEVKRDQIEQSGEVVDVEIRIVPTEFRAPWYVALGADDPSDERQRVRAARDKVHERARLLEELSNDEERNKLAVEIALQASTWTDFSDGMIVDRYQQFILLSDRREQCHRLDALLAARGVPAGLFIGGADYAQQFQVTLAGMKTHELMAAVGTYQAIGVGFEASRELSIGVACMPCVFNPKSRMQFNQYRGRFARSAPGKERGVFYYLWDQHVYGINPVRLLCKWNKSVKVQTPAGWVEGKRFLKDA